MSSTFDKVTLLAQFDQIHDRMKSSDVRPALAFPPVKRPARRVHPILYLPVEVKARELHARAILAKQAVAEGFSVIIGPTWSMNPWAQHLPAGVALFKSMNAVDAENIRWWISHGHMTAVLDEEVFGVIPTREYLAATIHPHAAAFADAVFAQGPSYAAAFPYPVKLHVTGNLRVQTYRKSRGTDILVCLQSGNINNNGRSFETMIEKTLGLGPPLGTPAGEAWTHILRSSIAHECDVLPLVRASIDALADAFPQRRVMVRPHPVEDPSIWKTDRANVAIDASNSIMDALQTAGVVVFVSGCTTGLDAYLANVPAVRLGSGGHGISSRMHAEANTPDNVVAAVGRAEHWTGNIADHFAAPNMIAPLRDLYRNNSAVGTPKDFPVIHGTPNEFVQRKFPETSAEEIRTLVGSDVKQLSWNTFMIAAR